MNKPWIVWCLGMVLASASVGAQEPDAGFASVDRPKRSPAQEMVDAAGTGDVTTVRRLLDAGTPASVAVSGSGAQALHQAAANGHVSLVKLLIERGALVDCQDHDGASPLVYAAYQGRAQVVDVLLASGARLDHLPKRQVHALNAAVMSGSIDTVRALLEAGADPRLQDVFGKSAEVYVTQVGRSDLRELLDRAAERSK